MTGIYYRVIPDDKFKYSGHHCIYLLGLCYSKTFKNHSEIIMQYIARKVNKFIDIPFNAVIAGQSFLCQVKIEFFSLDSKAAAFLLGFKQSFNHPYCCRFCIHQRDDFGTCFAENSEIRTQELYESQITGSNGRSNGRSLCAAKVEFAEAFQLSRFYRKVPTMHWT